MQESICKHCGVPIYIPFEGQQLDGFWSSSKVDYDTRCIVIGDRHELAQVALSTLDQKRHLLAAKEIMHRDLMEEIETLRREITQEELQKWTTIGVKS